MKRRALVLTIFAAVWFACSVAEAAFIDYRFTGTGVFGAVDAGEFNNASLSISITGDTTNVLTDAIGPYITGLAGTLSLTGGDLATPYAGTFVDTLYVFADNTQEIVGFGSDVTLFDLISIYVPNAGLDTYGLQYAFGPISAGIGSPGTTIFNYFDTTTSFGGLALDTIDNLVFEAIGPQPPSVPEPGTLVLLLGLAALSFARGRRTT